MDYGIVKPVLVAFFVSVVLSPLMIRYLHKLKFGQFIRGEGPESHLKKSGTPTMGGLIILLGIVVASLFYVKDYPAVIPILFVTLGFGFIGFIDDYIKVVMKRNLGLRAWQKMLGQILVTGILSYPGASRIEENDFCQISGYMHEKTYRFDTSFSFLHIFNSFDCRHSIFIASERCQSEISFSARSES